MAKASGTVPTMAASGAAAAITRNTILGVVRVRLSWLSLVDIGVSITTGVHWSSATLGDAAGGPAAALLRQVVVAEAGLQGTGQPAQGCGDGRAGVGRVD